MAGQSGPRQPGQGNSGGRMRNTLANLQSHNKIDYKNPGGKSVLPAMSPEMTANYYQSLAGLYAQYQNQLAGFKQQRVGLRSNFNMARKAIQGEKIGALASDENAQIERGMAGSTAAANSAIGIRGAAAAQVAGERSAMLQGVAQTRLGAQGAAIEYQQGATALEGNKLAYQQQMMAQQLERNLIISGQESQADAMQAIYEALAGQGGNGGGNNRRGGNGRNGPTWQNADMFPGGFYGAGVPTTQGYLDNLYGDSQWQTGGGY